MKINKRWFAAGVALASVAAGTGIAYAAWTASGSGSGSGRAITAQVMTVSPVTPGATGASLYPGGPAGWVYFTLTNPNPYDVTVTHLAWGAPASADTANCPSSNISVDANAPTSINFVVPAHSTSGALQEFSVLDLAHSAPDGCQGVAFTVPLTVTGTQT
jgi:hypothetical protein